MVHKQLMKHLEFNSFLSEQQFGFRPNRSTELAVTFFTDLIRKEADGGKATGSVFIDLSKAFDTISHSVFFLEKLSRYGIQDNETELVYGLFIPPKADRSIYGSIVRT